jgi:protein-L-isoaspartate(D-aspartate) O-methyltransferase
MRTIIQILFSAFSRFSVAFVLILMSTSCPSTKPDSENKHKNRSFDVKMEQENDTSQWKEKARSMVRLQLISRGITDQNVLRVMENTPRHLFVPESQSEAAYTDGPLPIGEGQTISQPFIVAIMTELLELKGHEKVLEIGTGSGYQAAVLAQLVDTCYSIELVKKLAETSHDRLQRLGYANVITKCGDGYNGWPEYAPFDRIIITAAPPEIPKALIEQLKPEGKMVLPVGKFYQELIVVTRTPKGISRERIIPVRFVPMVKPDSN